MKINVIIPAGGSSSRYKNGNKLLEILGEKSVIEHTINAFLQIKEISEIIISASKELMPEIEKITQSESKINIVEGGNTRQESVFNGLKACGNCDIVLIHDAARPLISPEIIKKSIVSAIEKKAVIVAVKTIDTIKIVDDLGKIISTPNRDTLWNVQTPQAFSFQLIFDAHKQLEGKNFSDDAGMLESLGVPVYVIEGEYSNFKITTQSDKIQAEIFLNSNKQVNSKCNEM